MSSVQSVTHVLGLYRSRASSPGETPAGDDCQKNVFSAGERRIVSFWCGILPGGRMAYSYVLVVDDDPAIRGLVADALRGEGYSVDLAAHGREALDAMRARCPVTVVLDLMMPVMDGISFMEACLAEQLCGGVPIVVISAAHEAMRKIQ